MMKMKPFYDFGSFIRHVYISFRVHTTDFSNLISVFGGT